MTNEIKEILDNPKILMLSYGNYISLDDYVKLKDYITNLQNENDDLKSRLENAVADCNLRIQENDDLKNRLKNGYCELKEKCNNGECDCSNEEYWNMCEANMKLSLLLDNYKSRNKKAIELLKRYGNGTFDEELIKLLQGEENE